MKNSRRSSNSVSSKHTRASHAAFAILVMLILAAPCRLLALDVTFTKIAPLPTQSSIISVGKPYVGNGDVYYVAKFDTGSDTIYGLVKNTNAAFFLEGGSIDGAEVSGIGITSINGDKLVAGGYSDYMPGDPFGYAAIFQFTGGNGSRIVDKLTPIPGFASPLGASVTVGAVDGNRVAFFLPRVTIPPTSPPAVCLWEGGSVSLVATNGTPIPGSASSFQNFDPPFAANNAVQFFGSGSGGVRGFYEFANGVLTTIVDSTTMTPEGDKTFGSSFTSTSIVRNGSEYAFSTDGTVGGVFKIVGGELKTVIRLPATVPGGTGNFATVASPSVENGKVAFVGWRNSSMSLPLEYGIYTDFGGTIEPVVDVHTTLDGKTPVLFSLNRGNAFIGNDVYFYVRFDDDSEAIYKATLSAQPLVTSNLDPSGSALVLNWDDSSFHLQTAPTATGIYTNVPGATSPHTNVIGAPQQFFRLQHD